MNCCVCAVVLLVIRGVALYIRSKLTGVSIYSARSGVDGVRPTIVSTHVYVLLYEACQVTRPVNAKTAITCYTAHP